MFRLTLVGILNLVLHIQRELAGQNLASSMFELILAEQSLLLSKGFSFGGAIASFADQPHQALLSVIITL